MYRPTALAPNLPGGCGHPPLRGWEVLPRNLAQPVRGKTLYALSLVISRYRFRYCQAEFSPETFVPGEFLRISDQSTGQRKALSCLERVDRAEPGTGVEGTPDIFGRAASNGKTCRNSSEMKVDKC